MNGGSLVEAVYATIHRILILFYQAVMECHQVWNNGMVRQSLHSPNHSCSAWYYRLLWRWWGGL